MGNKRCLKLGVTIFASLASVVFFAFLLFHYQAIYAFVSMILSALHPVWTGIVLAYLLYPAAAFLEGRCQRIKWLSTKARLVSVLLTVILAFGAVVLFSAMALPQLAESVSGLANDLPDMLEAQLGKLRIYLESENSAAEAVLQMISSAETSLTAWIKENLFSTVSSVASGVMSVGSAMVNLIVAVIVTIYLLMDRERYMAQCRKLFLSVSTNPRVNRAVWDIVRQSDRIFIGFISGKLLDSLIVGIICFVCMLLFHIPYALLISVIVGVANIVPIFGPVIGTVSGAFLLLLVSPEKCFIFLALVVILQQADGNIIGPRILGNSTGLSALYVTAATLIFGKMMGFIGMIVGVPLFAVLYYIVKRIAEYSLRKQGMPVSTADYETRIRPE